MAADLTAEGVSKKFTSRRGVIKTLFSDNATNFVAASKLMNNIEWHFIPSRAPHLGELWEAMMKSFKIHFRKVVGEHKLTYEEFFTLTTQIEAVLHSRPLTPISNDPNHFSCLTPSPIGDLLSIVPDTDGRVEQMDHNHNNRWAPVQRLHRRWYTEYLRGCQKRVKWTSPGGRTLALNRMVMVMGEGTPCRWTLGRITDLHEGADGIVRVVTVRTNGGEYKRPVVKIAPLPEENI